MPIELPTKFKPITITLNTREEVDVVADALMRLEGKNPEEERERLLLEIMDKVVSGEIKLPTRRAPAR